MTYYATGNKAGKLLANILRGLRYKLKIPYVIHPKTTQKEYKKNTTHKRLLMPSATIMALCII